MNEKEEVRNERFVTGQGLRVHGVWPAWDKTKDGRSGKRAVAVI